MKYRQVKIDVLNAEQSKAVQEYLFTQDCKWCDGKVVGCTDRRYLYVDSDGLITHGNGFEYFRSHDYKEVFFDFEVRTVAKPKPRATTVLFGITYDREELQKALDNLTPVQL
jgi:hypothetical protein